MAFAAAAGTICLLLAACFCVCLGDTPAIFAFGDSLVDPGNNNNLNTQAKANHPPYGVDFDNDPTGRFSNGKLVVDFIAGHLGLKNLPAYHQIQDGDDISQGVNFASASSGIMSSTHMQAAETLSTQIGNFKSVKDQFSDDVISKSIFYICTGNNDVNDQFHSGQPVDNSYILGLFSNYIQELYNYGARKFVIIGLSAVGCIPANAQNGDCNSDAQSAATSYNSALKSTLSNLRDSLSGTTIVETDFFQLMVDVHDNPGDHGFDNASTGCCPSGCQEGSDYCSDRSKYAFWDGFHQTQAFNEMASGIWWSGSGNSVSPMSIKELAAL